MIREDDIQLIMDAVREGVRHEFRRPNLCANTVETCERVADTAAQRALSKIHDQIRQAKEGYP